MGNGWPVRRLADVVTCLDTCRKPVRAADRSAGPYPYYGASGVIDYVDQYLLDGTYALVAEDGENLRSRTTAVAFLAKGKIWVNNHAHVLDGGPEADVRFVANVVENADISGYLTGSTQPKLTQQSLLSMRLPWPPLSEQRAIAEVLGALDDKIEANRRMETAGWSLAKAQFDALTAEPDEFVPLGSLLSLAYGKSLTAGARLPGTTAVYGSGGVVGWHNKPLASGPGIIVGRKGTAGAVHWCQTDFFAIDTTFYVENSVVPMLFAYFLLRSLGLDHMNSDSAVPGLNRSAALGRLVPLPGENSLAEFSRSAEPLIEAVGSTRRENWILASLRDTLLPKLLSGQLRVRDAEKLVGEAV